MSKIQVVSTRFRDHPPGLFYLFFAEMWERFSYYGLRGMLVFYVTSDFSWTQVKAFGVYGTYTALVYSTPIIGGLLADRILGDRKAIMIGGILISLGHIALALPGEILFYGGLAFIISGTGLFKANISALLGKLYPHGDHRRDAGFTLFYVGINLGSFLASLTCGYVGKYFGWHYGFSLAAFGMILGLVFFFRGLPTLQGHGLPSPTSIYNKPAFLGLKWEHVVYLLAFLSVPVMGFMIKNHEHFDYILPIVGIIVIAYMVYLSLNVKGDDRRNILVILLLMFFYMSFFALFEQIGSSINFFAELQVNRNFAGFWGDQVPAIAFQSLNPFFVILLGPIFAKIWIYLATKNVEPYAPFKFFLGLFPTALGFGLLGLSTHYADASGLISPWWLVAAYFIQTAGEVCISPVGIAMVTKLAPPHMTGTLMGIWFISVAYGNYLAGALSKLSAVDLDQTGAAASLSTYGDAFTSVAYMGLGISALLLVISPFLRSVFKREEEMRGYNE